MTLNDLISTHKINATHLAAMIDMPRGTFTNKLSENHIADFTAEERKAINKALQNIASGINVFLNQKKKKHV